MQILTNPLMIPPVTDRPPIKIDGKRNPEYDRWYRAQKNRDPEKEVIAAVVPTETPPEEREAMIHELEQDEVLTLRCVKLAKNNSFVYCDRDGVCVPVKIKKGIGNRLLKKPIKVRFDGESYTHTR